MILTSCPDKNYFEIQELWFHYQERLDFESKGIMEGQKIFVEEKTDDYIVVKTEIMTINLNYEEANNVYGEVYINKKQKRKKR